ncbi:MAG: transcription termination factor NusA, partial [Methyloligellaceae bacterium]
AREFLERQEAELDARRKELGVDDDLAALPGLTTAMLVALGEKEVKTVEDVADCATDDLTGWYEKVDGESVRQPGFLDGFDVSRPDAETLIMSARVKAGWISEEALLDDEPEPENEDVEEGAADAALIATDGGGVPDGQAADAGTTE